MKVYKLRKCTRSPVPQQEEQLPSSLVKEEQGGVRTAQVDNTSPRDASAAAVEEGVHATHSKVRCKREVFICAILFFVSSSACCLIERPFIGCVSVIYNNLFVVHI